MRNRVVPFAVLAAIAAGLLVGCGGSDPPSKQEFAQNADKICADVESRVNELNKANPQSISDLTRFIDQLKSTVDDGINRLQGLDRPKGDAGNTAKQFTDTLDTEYKDQVLPALDQLEKAVVDRDKKALRAASKRLDAVKDTKSNQLAAQLGAKKCAK
jgi:hypothetical protein